MSEFRIRRPDDMHVHLRDKGMLKMVLPYTARLFSRGVVMGNLPKPIVTGDEACQYRDRILEVSPAFKPIMTIMLTQRTTPQIVEEAFGQGVRILKYIPGNTSTNSKEGVALHELHRFYLVLEKAECLGMIFSGHWEMAKGSSGAAVPEIEREVRAIYYLEMIAKQFPLLKMVVEHASSKKMIEFVRYARDGIVASLTAHHAILVYDDVCKVAEKITDPYNYCYPVAKGSLDRLAVIRAMTSGIPKFFFGSDSAPHPRSAKRKEPPAAGIFTAPVVLPLLCKVFEQEGRLAGLEDFVSTFGARFYGLEPNEGTIVIKREEWVVPELVGDIPVFMGGKTLSWKAFPE